MGGALVAISAPVYWLGLVALYLFSNDIGRVAASSRAPAPTRTPTASSTSAGRWSCPGCVLAAAFAAIYARLLRSNLLETMREDYIRTARAKGLSRAHA